MPNKKGAVVSPDGRFVYYAERLGGFNYNATFPIWQVHRFDRDTSDVATLTEAQGSAMRPAISPDGKHLVFATRLETGTALRVWCDAEDRSARQMFAFSLLYLFLILALLLLDRFGGAR